MFASDKPVRRRAAALLAGFMIFPSVSIAAEALGTDNVVAPPPEVAPATPSTGPSESCLAETLCALKNRVRWRTAKWSPSYCRLISKGVLTASKKHKLSPALLVAVMINESDMNEQAVATHFRDGSLYAKDSGLMGIRCVVGTDGRCTNGIVKGMSWKTVMDPVNNIEIGARLMASYRDGDAFSRVTKKIRAADGSVVTKTKTVPCEHKTHAFWAHYNHGPVYIDKGPARHYPHRVGVLYNELAKALDLPAPELDGRVTIVDPGKRARTVDRPIGARQRELCEKIRAVSGLCTNEERLRTTASN